jgi:hypothetical protein
LAQTALGACQYFPQIRRAAFSRPEIAFVTYWEWAKLIMLSMGISVAMTAAVAGAGWLILN